MAIADYVFNSNNAKEKGSGYAFVSDDDGVTYKRIPVFKEFGITQNASGTKQEDDSGKTFASTSQPTDRMTTMTVITRDEASREAFLSYTTANSLIGKTLYLFYVGAGGLTDGSTTDQREYWAGKVKITPDAEYNPGQEGVIAVNVEWQYNNTGADINIPVPSNSEVSAAMASLMPSLSGTVTLADGEYAVTGDSQ